MAKVKVEFNVDNENWHKELPDIEKLVEESCVKALESSGITNYTEFVDISVMLTSDDLIKVLNQKYREQDKPTNVLSFPSEEIYPDDYDNLEDQLALGDIIFAFETIKAESVAQNKSMQDHLCHLAVHGTLHLLGFDHLNDQDAKKMESLEVKILKKMNISNPYS